jgi:nucleotide-binding universal stress UspA family protein
MNPNASTRPGTVVVGYDGSEHAEHALRWAADEAVLEGRPLSIVHVVKPLTGYEISSLAGTWVPPEEIRHAIRTDAVDMLTSVRDRLEATVPELEIELVLTSGDARQVLLDESATASSMFVGSRGRGPIASLLLGSVSVAVSRSAQCPTFVIRPHHPGRVRHGVLVGTDCTEQSQPTLEFAYRQASLRGLPLTVVYCVASSGVVAGVGRMIDDNLAGYEEERLAMAEAVAGMGEKFPDVNVRLRLGLGVPDVCLVEESHRMDVLVVGHHHGKARGDLVRLGSFVTSVVESAECPVAIVADQDQV